MKYSIPSLFMAVLLLVGMPGTLFAYETLSQTNNANAVDFNSAGAVQERCKKAGGTWIQTQSFPPQTRCVFPADRTPDARPNSVDVVRPIDRATSTTQRPETDFEFLRRLADRVDNLFDNILERLQGAIERLSDISDRIASRIEKLETEHAITLDVAREHLSEAERSLAYAQETLDDISPERFTSAIDTADNREALREVYTTLRETIREVRDAILDARESLVAAVREIKAAVDTRNIEATGEQNNETKESDVMLETTNTD